MSRSLFRYSVLAVGALAILITSGCGSGIKTYPVEGKVEFEDGSPVMFGTIEFLNRDQGLNARGKINRDGTFTVGTLKDNDGAVEGTHEVTIQQFVTIPLVAGQPIEIEHDHGNLVSEIYRSYDTNDLTVVVEAKSNQLTLKVKAQE